MSSPITSEVASSLALRQQREGGEADAGIAQARWSSTLVILDRYAPPMAFVALIAAWEGLTRVFSVPSFLLPAPSVVIEAALSTTWNVWLGHIWATIRVALMGYALAIIVAIPLAIALSSSRLLSRTLFPMLVVVQSTPVVAIAPIIVVTLGASDLPRVVITFLICFFPIVVSTVTGLMSTPEELIELSRSLRAGRLRELLHVRLPFALPHVFSALKISTTLAVVGAVVAELVAAEKGLGFFIALSTSFFKVPLAFAALAVLVAISLGLFRLVALTQRLIAPWSLPRGAR